MCLSWFVCVGSWVFSLTGCALKINRADNQCYFCLFLMSNKSTRLGGLCLTIGVQLCLPNKPRVNRKRYTTVDHTWGRETEATRNPATSWAVLVVHLPLDRIQSSSTKHCTQENCPVFVPDLRVLCKVKQLDRITVLGVRGCRGQRTVVVLFVSNKTISIIQILSLKYRSTKTLGTWSSQLTT